MTAKSTSRAAAPATSYDELRASLEQAVRKVDELQAGAGTPNETSPAAAAFLETVRETLGDESRLTPEAARRGALLAVASQAWGDALDGLLDSADVRSLLGLRTRQAVDARLRAQTLIGLQERSGRWRFPAFQFVGDTVNEPLVAAFWAITEGLEPWTAASWCVSPHDGLDGRSPRDWLADGHDAQRLLNVAERDAARLAQ